MNKKDSKGWLSCMAVLVIAAIVLTVLMHFGWLLFPAIILINIVRSFLWNRKIMKVGRRDEDSVPKENHSDSDKYCEAEFEIMDDEE